MQSLADADVVPDDITDVVFTHLHSDHIGWASADGIACFPNAVYRCATADLDYFFGPDVDEAFSMLMWGTLSARDRLSPILNLVETWDSDEAIAPGIDVRLAPGHTPGSSVVVLSSGADRALILGDMVHCPMELQDDEWQCIGDVDPVLAKRARAAYVAELETGSALAAGSHFPGLRFGRLLPGEGTRGWVFA
jgi:glyoxylase-like metal-dependent hydrolase (beta-lactamase superfamily II)